MNNSDLEFELQALRGQRIAGDGIGGALQTTSEADLDKWFADNPGKSYSMSSANALREHRLRLRQNSREEDEP